MDRRALLDFLTQRLHDLPQEDLAGLDPEDLERLDRARRAFLTAGARAVDELADFEQSLQVLVRTEGDGFLAGPLLAELRRWRADGLFDTFFFMRKPPGVRLRFFTRDRRALGEALAAFLERERTRGAVADWANGIYDAETHQFGGEEGLSLMHLHGTDDSLWALEIERRRATLSADVSLLSLVALNDLFRRVTLDPWEGWDIWENMRLAARVVDDSLDPEDLEMLQADAEAQRATLAATWFEPERIVGALSEDDRSLMEACFAANEAWAARYRTVADRLSYGIRKILPFYVVFHWNRLGFDVETQVTLAFYMRHVLNPKLASKDLVEDRSTS